MSPAGKKEKPKYRCWAESSFSFFDAEEPGYGTVDLVRSFNVGKGLATFRGLCKFAIVVVSIIALAIDLYEDPFNYFYMAYLTRWTLCNCLAYLFASLILTAIPSAGFLLKFVWTWASLATVHGIMISLLYWFLDWVPEYGVQFHNVMTHGGVAFLCYVNAFVLDRTPIRLKHIAVNWFWAVCYLIWSIIHNTVIMHNPHFDDDDDAIYDVLKWRTDTGSAVILACVVVFVAVPLFQTMVWAISLPGRVYLEILP